MITKAFITEVPASGNIFKVRVPLMEDNTGSEAIFKALVCTSPESYKGYNVGDCVFVSWEDDRYDTAIILGKLFVSVPQKTSTFNVVNELKVTDAASLPPSTRFGDYTALDLINLYNKEGTGNGISQDDLEDFVRYEKTERIDESGDNPEFDYYYADHIQCMSGIEYDRLWEEEHSLEELEKMNRTLYFLTSPPPSEEQLEEDTDPDYPYV